MNQSKLFGDRAFYRRTAMITVPILIQNVITNFVSLLDNIMVGQVGTESMSGVAIVNQLMFVFILFIFGGMSGPGIFTAQFHGKGDPDGVRHTFRAKLYVGIAAIVLFGAAFLLAGRQMISLFLHQGSDDLNLAATLDFGMDYLHVIMLQMLPFALMQAYSSTLRETGETVLPMKAGITAVLVNVALNYVLIFGKLGAPALGVVGAAIATVIARIVECAIVVIWTHTHKAKAPFIRGAYRSLKVPMVLMKQIIRMGLPLLFNEVMWALGMTTLNQCYSVRGLEVVSATNIATTIAELFNCVFMAMGSTVSIMVGQLLGAGELERAVDEDRKLIVFTLLMNAGMAIVMALLAPFIPRIYNTTETVKHYASVMLLINAGMMPFSSVTHAAYFTLRSGGKTIITMMFDCGYSWCLAVPFAFILSRFTALPILQLYLCCHCMDLVKCAVGVLLVRSRKWVNNLVRE